MNMTGSWYSPAYSGEGIDVFEHPDGRIVAHFFSYDDGRQMWLVCSGKRMGKMATLEVWTTSGGDIGGQTALRNVVEKPWGIIELSEVPTGLHVWFAPNDQQPWSYTMQSIFDPVDAPIPTPVPPPVPTPPPATGPVLKFEINPSLDGTRWYDTGYPVLWGTDKVPEPNISRWHYRARFKVVSGGPLIITKTITSGPHNPHMTGIKEWAVYQNGEGAVLNFYIGPQTTNKSSGWEMTNFEVFAKETGLSLLPGMEPGQIVKLSAQVVYS